MVCTEYDSREIHAREPIVTQSAIHAVATLELLHHGFQERVPLLCTNDSSEFRCNL